MKQPFLALALGVVCALTAGPAGAADWDLVWSDEFDGTSLDLSKWEPQIGTGCPSLCGWGNNELQYYRAENATVSGGTLTIEARKEYYGGRNYTSARLRTRGLADWTYGRFEMRAKLPIGQGLWSAFWMLPTDSPYGGWAASGEIDIVEVLGHEPDQLHGTIHYGGSWPDNTSAGQSTTLASGTFHDDFHVFALEWEPTELRWYLDGRLYATQTSWYSEGQPVPAPFDEQFHLLLNLAVGGDWPGNPDGSTVFPQQLVVDYVRVYEDADACEVVYDGMDHAAPHSNGWFQFGGSVGGGGIGANTGDLPPAVGGSASIEAGFGGSPGFVGGFGRGRDLDLSAFTHFEFWINPDPGQSYLLEMNLQDDDDGSGTIAIGPDDEFQYDVVVGGQGSDVLAGGGWQKVSIPFTDFRDDNSYLSGGNGVLDAVPVGDGGNGMLASIVVAIINQGGPSVSFRTDRWAFTRRTASIEGRVWDDLDQSGTRDAGEPGIESATLQLLDASATVIATTISGTDGAYQFTALEPADYSVRIDPATLATPNLPTHDPDGTVSTHEFSIGLSCDETRLDGDFGYRLGATDAPDPRGFSDHLHPATPNPFNARTVIDFELARAGRMELVIFDTQGRLVRVLEAGDWPAGRHRSTWDGRDDTGSAVASGVYHAALRTGRGQSVTRMVLLK